MNTQTLCISVTFLTGRYHGGEWPPSPARLYQALVAGVSTCGYSEHVATVEPALRWLEQQAPPEIRASPHFDAESYCISVPNNDLDAVARHWAAGRLPDSASPRTDETKLRTMKTVKPKAMCTNGPHVQYVWRVDTVERAPMWQPLRTAVHCLHTLGWGIDMAYADLSEEASPAIVYHPSVAGSRFAVPMPGTLDDLKTTYARFTQRSTGHSGVDANTRPSILRMQSYRRDEDFSPPWCGFMLIKPDSDVVKPVAWRNCMKVAGWMRHAAAETLRREYAPAFIDEYIQGHVPLGNKSKRVSYVPLPSIYDRYNDGQIRRVLVVEPADAVGEVVEMLSLKLTGSVLTGKDQREECMLGPADPEEDWVFNQYVPKVGRRVWRSVTPVVLHGHNLGRHGSISIGKTEGLLLRAFEMAGITESRIAALAFQTAPLWPGTGNAKAILTPDHLKGYPKFHVEVRFKDDVRGPVLAGIGRHYGIGVFASV